jgi:predicted DNA-binding protein (UPF0251 family)
LRLYSNPEARLETLQRLLLKATSTGRHREQPVTRQTQIRLAPHEVTALAAVYRDGKTIKELAQRYGIHRTTVTALLSRQGVKLRRRGLTSEEIPGVALLYYEGWSLPRLGARFDVNAATVWRTLREAGIAMRSPNERRS